MNSENYPRLARILDARRQAKRNRIIVILEYLAQDGERSFYLNPADPAGAGYTDIPYKEMEARGGGRNLYAAVINFLCATGLLIKHNPNTIDRNHMTPIDADARQHAGRQRAKRRISGKKYFSARIYYHLPLWTDALLQRAEDLAQANTGTLTRVIDTYGADQAQRCLDTKRGIPRDTQRAREQIKQYVVNHIDKGFITKAEILQAVHLLTTKELNRRRQGAAAQPAEGRKTVDIKNILPAYMPTLAKELGLNYGRPTADQAAKYKLKDKSFILTAKQEHI